MVAWGNNPKAKIRGRTKLGESAAVFVETETGGELISFWNAYFKELTFVPTELARRAVEEFRIHHRSRIQRSGDVVTWVYAQCIMAPLLFSGPLSGVWSFLASEWGVWMTLAFVLVPMIFVAFVCEHVYNEVSLGISRVRNPDQYLVKKYLREIEPSIAKSTVGFFRRIFGRGKK
jgi:hypothetical protein